VTPFAAEGETTRRERFLKQPSPNPNVERAIVRMRMHLRDSCRVKQSFSDGLLRRVWKWVQVSRAALTRGRRIFFMGNGGSAADAQHIVAELVGRFLRERPPLPAIALTTNTSSLTAIANDYGYEDVFERQVRALVRRGDIVVGITTSGRSPNVLRALKAARAKGAFTVGLTGAHGEELKIVAQLVIDVPSESTPRIQESHITIGHIFCDLLDICYPKTKRPRANKPRSAGRASGRQPPSQQSPR